jgi:hypothetical protein
MVIECINETQKATLLRAKIVYNSKDCVYVTFRKPLTSQNNCLPFLGDQGLGESIATWSFLVGSPHVLVVPLMNLRALDKINQSEK